MVADELALLPLLRTAAPLVGPVNLFSKLDE